MLGVSRGDAEKAKAARTNQFLLLDIVFLSLGAELWAIKLFSGRWGN
jgi:hypothetical protein